MYNATYVAANGNEYVFNIGAGIVQTSTIWYNRRMTEQACRKACNNFASAGGCPPRAPHFEDLRLHYPEAYVVYAVFTTDQVPERLLKIPQWAFVSMTFQDALLSRFMNYVGNNLKAELDKFCFGASLTPFCPDCVGGYCPTKKRVCGGGVMLLGQGHCMGCISCAFKKGAKQCVRPAKRVFSLEATGVLVDALMLHKFGLDTHWWSFQTEKPPYMMKTIALLLPDVTENEDQLDGILFEVVSGHKAIKEVRCDE